MRKITSVALASLCLALINTSGVSAVSIAVLTPGNTPDDNLVEYLHSTSISAYSDPLQQAKLADSPVFAVEKTPAAIEAPEKKTVKKEVKPKKVTHTVAAGESLITIAKEYDTNWKRIYYKNTSIKNPDSINKGLKIVIPAASEKLKKRALPQVAPAPAPIVAAATPQVTAPATQSAPAPAPVQQVTQSVQTLPGSSAGNTYYAGYCTWYAKSRRPDLPNNLGNADTWAARASGQGIATGSTPRAGAIAQAVTGFMHVAYVESVNANGTVTVSEMNYSGFGVVSTRTAPASEFVYIY